MYITIDEPAHVSKRSCWHDHIFRKFNIQIELKDPLGITYRGKENFNC